MMTEPGFPRMLLKQTKAERLKYFNDYTVAHPQLVEVYHRLRSEMATAALGSLIFVCGPTGVGKTTLLRRIEQRLTAEMQPALEQDPGRLPIVMLEALAPESGNFNWKDFYRRLLVKLDEPCIEKKIAPYLRSVGRPEREQIPIGARAVGAELRHAAEQVLQFRRPVAVFIDEAQHLTKMVSGRKLQDQLDCIKSLANLTGITIVLTGTYELLPFRNLSAQLSRRSIDLHFRRYRAESGADLQRFKNVLWTFQRHLPLAQEPDLVAQWDFFYERSLGCVGVLKQWLSKALAAALNEGGETLAPPHLTGTGLSVSQCEKMLAETREGETKLAETEAARRSLRSRLGLEPTLVKPSQSAVKDGGETGSRVTARRRKKLPGQRNPKRDPVGKTTGDETNNREENLCALTQSLSTVAID